ncbi:unnamed protein product, partial [Schistosoma mattheei]
MEYKSEIIHSPNFNCQQSLHYDCVSLIPLNKYNSRNYNLERANYQFNDNKYCDNSMNQFHMNVPIQSNSQIKSYNHINTERNTLNLPLYLTHSHSTQFINNLQTLKEFNHQITDNLYNL